MIILYFVLYHDHCLYQLCNLRSGQDVRRSSTANKTVASLSIGAMTPTSALATPSQRYLRRPTTAPAKVAAVRTVSPPRTLSPPVPRPAPRPTTAISARSVAEANKRTVPAPVASRTAPTRAPPAAAAPTSTPPHSNGKTRMSATPLLAHSSQQMPAGLAATLEHIVGQVNHTKSHLPFIVMHTITGLCLSCYSWICWARRWVSWRSASLSQSRESQA